MTDTRLAIGTERLPWLSNEPKAAPKRKSRSIELAGWAVASLLAVAGGSYWLGTRTAPERVAPVALQQPAPAVPPAPVQEKEQGRSNVALPPTPEVHPAPAPEVRIAAPAPEPRVHRSPKAPAAAAPKVPETASDSASEAIANAQPVAAPVTPRPLASIKDLKLWPATQSAGAAGKIVRIGAFGTRQQAKLGWRRMVAAFPAVAHLPATVVKDRNSRGRTFYRFQIGTTSQAHSEVLCQRMQWIRFSCAVVGLPWKPAGVER